MKDCIFCKIVNKELDSKTIYEDDIIQIFLNIEPSTNAHLLVIPKKHYDNLLDIDINIISHSLEIVRERIYPLLKETLGCKGLTLSQNNELGQDIKHYHLHLIPRYDNDSLHFTYNKEILYDLDTVFDKIKRGISS